MSIFKRAVEYFLRICVFQVGEYKRGPIARKIIRFLKRHYDLSDKEVDLCPQLFEGYIQILEALGGSRAMVTPADGGAQIDYMLLTFENVKKRIEEKGGRWIEIAIERANGSHYKVTSAASNYLHVILAERETPEWQAFVNGVLVKLGWEKAVIEYPEGNREILITDYAKEKLRGNSQACFLRCHAPGRSYGMDQKYIGRHLSIKKDLCLFNYRGTHRSTGRPSEGGYYLDAEAMFQELISNRSYQPWQIWVTGFCLGGAVAAFLKAKYHSQGVNFVGENTFTSLADVVEFQIWPSSILWKYSMKAIQSNDPSITSKVEQDFFDTVKKFNSLNPETKRSITIIISTDADEILPKNSSPELARSAGRAGIVYELVHHSLYKKNPHADHVFDEQKIWDRYCDIIS